MKTTDLLEVYPFNLVRKVLKEDSEVPQTYAQGVLNALSTLTEKEQSVLERRFKERMTLERCGVDFELTRERIRQIEAKALRKLRYPATANRMKAVSMKQFNDLSIEHQKLQEDYRVLKEEYEALLKVFSENNEGKKYQSEQIKLLSTPIEDLDLSVRSLNVLIRNARKSTLGDITQMTYDDLMQIRNAGRKTANEIMKVLGSFGLTLKDQ